MKYFITLFFILLFITNCKNAPNNDFLSDTTIPILLNEHKKDVREKLGIPEKSTNYFDSYFSKGFVFDYDSTGNVIMITISVFDKEYISKDQIFGVSLNDSIAKCIKKFGENFNREKTRFNYDRVYWILKDYVLDMDVWSSSFQDFYFGNAVENTIKEIRLYKYIPL